MLVDCGGHGVSRFRWTSSPFADTLGRNGINPGALVPHHLPVREPRTVRLLPRQIPAVVALYG